MKNASGVLAVSLVSVLVTACGSVGRPMPELAPEINATLETGVFRISPMDTLRIAFPTKPEWNQVVQVRWDGRASFLFVGEVAVGGLSLEQVHEILTRGYEESGVLETVDLAVNLEEMAPRHIVVMGEVRTPGEIVLSGRPISLVEAIGFSGGPLKATASMQDVVLVRWRSDQQRRMAWVIDASVDWWGQAEPIWLQEHDVVFVPNTAIDDVNLWIDKYMRRMLPLPGSLYTPVLN